MIFFIGLLTTLATFLGGIFALRFKDRLHLILGFSAGAVLGVAFFDLLPEAVTLTSGTYNISAVTTVLAVGFGLFMLLDRYISLHAHDEEDDHHNHRGKFGAGVLSIHSFLDGLGIGLAFKVSPEVGLIVTAAVLAHDFSDGINTVSVIIKNQGSRLQAFKWLLIDAAAPLIGIIATLFFSLSDATLGLVLALFCGFFLYLGASDILPESYHRHPTYWTTFMTIAGAGLLYLVIQLAG